MTAQDYMAPESIGRLQQRALAVGVVGSILCLIGWLRWPSQFFHSYLNAFLLVLGLSLGSMGLLMLQHLTSGHWGIIIRRPLEAAMRTLWLVALLFVPVIFGMKYLYGAWLNAPATGEGSLSNFQRTYLTTPQFHPPCGYLFRSLAFVGGAAGTLVSPAGCGYGQPRLTPQVQDAQRARHHSLCLWCGLCLD